MKVISKHYTVTTEIYDALTFKKKNHFFKCCVVL